MEVTGAVDLPVSEKVLLRVAADYDDHGGYQHNVATNEVYGGAIRRAGRVTLVLKPIDNLQSRTVVEYGTTQGHPTINTIYSYYPCGAAGLVTTAACLYSPALDTVVGSAGAWNAYLAAHPGANPGGIPGALIRQQQLGIWAADSLQSNSLFQENWSATNTSTYDLDNVSEEAQVLGKAFASELDYVLGLYYSSNRHTEHDDLTYFDLTPVIPPSPSTFIFISTAKSEAAYAQGTYDLSSLTGVSGLKATAGLRYTWETDGLSYPVDPHALLSGGAAESKRFSNPSWQVGLEYKIRPELLLYQRDWSRLRWRIAPLRSSG